MNTNTYSKEIATAINKFLVEDDWHFTFDEKKGLFKFGLNLRGKLKNIRYLIDVKKEEYIVYAISPIGADVDDKSMMAAMAEFMCRANYGLMNGNFELDMNDGEIRFKVFVPCNGIIPSNKWVQNSIYCPAGMFKRYGDGIIDIIFNNSDVEETVLKCENEEELLELLSMITDSDDDVDTETMLARLASRLGVDSDTSEVDSGLIEDSTTATMIKMDLFGTEGEES